MEFAASQAPYSEPSAAIFLIDLTVESVVTEWRQARNNSELVLENEVFTYMQTPQIR